MAVESETQRDGWLLDFSTTKERWGKNQKTIRLSLSPRGGRDGEDDPNDDNNDKPAKDDGLCKVVAWQKNDNSAIQEMMRLEAAKLASERNRNYIDLSIPPPVAASSAPLSIDMELAQAATNKTRARSATAIAAEKDRKMMRAMSKDLRPGKDPRDILTMYKKIFDSDENVNDSNSSSSSSSSSSASSSPAPLSLGASASLTSGKNEEKDEEEGGGIKSRIRSWSLSSTKRHSAKRKYNYYNTKITQRQLY